jgi:putative ABC transport system permease protein
MNPSLAVLLAWRRLSQHRLQSTVTLLGVALGLTVAAAILIVDHNSSERQIASASLVDLSNSVSDRSGQPRTATPRRILKVSFERQGEGRDPAAQKPSDREPVTEREKTDSAGPLPSQEGLGAGGVSTDRPLPRRGEEDYQAMRLAVRLASLMAFAVGAVIVFYSMRFSVASRGRELMLLLCLGQERRGLGLSLAIEAALLGLAGTLLGLVAGWWTGLGLLDAGVSTTGRAPNPAPSLPWSELAMLAGLSLSIALLGVVGPLRSLLRMQPVDVLQPRFLAQQDSARGRVTAGLKAFGWMVPVLMMASWLAVRPILQDWLSLIQFFLVEAVVAAAMGLAILWWMGPALRGTVYLMEWALKPLLPLEALLAGRRLRITARELVFTVASVTLVFSLLIGLDGLTRSLKAEIRVWGAQALDPYVFLQHRPGTELPPDEVFDQARSEGLFPLRLSLKVDGEIPIRLIHGGDANAFLASQGLTPLSPDGVFVSRTLAARFALESGDRVIIDTEQQRHAFDILAVSDLLGYYAQDGQYVDLKSWFLFHHQAALFADNLALTVGDRLAVRQLSGVAPQEHNLGLFWGSYRVRGQGLEQRRWQTQEIDRDFSIFDFILGLTLVLAAVGVANSLLIQVLARRRELSLLRTLGVSRGQTVRLLVVEGAVIGGVGGLFALVLGHVFAALGIGFLDRFTLFDYAFHVSVGSALGALGLAVITCCLAALYPALVAGRLSSAESLHYE